MTKSSRPIIKIHDISTDEIIEREMNDEEFSQWQKDAIETESAKAEAQAKADARQALLNKLGITAEEAQLLLGGN